MRAGHAVVSMMLVLFLLPQPAAGQGKRMPRPDPASPRPGVTDTMHVERKPITLAEIISRAIEGEKTKLLGRTSLSYTMSVRTILLWEKKKEIYDAVMRAYTESNGFSRFVELNENKTRYKYEDGAWVEDEDDEELEPSVRVTADGFSDFTELPFFLEEVDEYTFELLGRTLEGDHVIFQIGFKPKSDFKALPAGTIYIDTTDYRIIHEEFRFSQNPFPMILKGLNRMSRHWDRLPTGEWVFTRVLADIEMHSYFGMVPDRVQLSLERSDFKFDEPYSVRLFGER
jgi:hypothetical protein